MSKVLPCQLVSAIDGMFGASRNEVDGHAITHVYRAEVHALLNLLDEVPGELIDLSAADYLEFSRCRAVLATSLALWNAGDTRPARDVGGKDAVDRIRRLMKQCHDDRLPRNLNCLSSLIPMFALVSRIAFEQHGQTSTPREWMGATVFAGAALEALLLWALRQISGCEKPAVASGSKQEKGREEN
jgi:hypothetical protein